MAQNGPSTGQNFPFYTDRDLRLVIQILNPDGSPAVFNAPTAVWAMAFSASSPIVLSKSTANPPGGIALAQVSGIWTATVTIARADTDQASGIKPGSYYHELAVTDAGGAENVTIGRATLNQSLNQIA